MPLVNAHDHGKPVAAGRGNDGLRGAPMRAAAVAAGRRGAVSTQTDGAHKLGSEGAVDEPTEDTVPATQTSNAATATLARLDQVLAAKRRVILPEPAERRRLRVEAGLSIRDLAEVLGVYHGTLRDWEIARVSPRNGRAAAYAAVLTRLAERQR